MLNMLPESFTSHNGKQLSPLAYIFILFLCVVFFTPGIASLPPIDRDEPLFAQASKQMVESGNYVDIQYQDAGRYKKPIGIYWLQAASVRLFNPNHLNEIWAYRIPSAVGATIAVLMTAALGTLLFNPMTGLLAAVMMAGCVMLNSEARLAKTDACLLAAIMVAQYALARAYLQRCTGWLLPLAFWAALGIGFLIKGPIILLVLCSTLFWLWRTEKNLSWFLSLKPIFGIPFTLLLVAPWLIAISLASHGAFLQQSAGHDMLAKIWQGQDRGRLPPGLHLLVFPVMFFPFSLLTILAVPDAWANRRRKAVRFCLGWIIPTWIVFELSFTKLPHYVLPTYPAITMLTIQALREGFPALAERNRRWPIALGVALWMMIGTAFAVGSALLPQIIDQTWSLSQIAASGCLVLAQGVALFLLFRRNKIPSVIVMAISSLIFISVTIGSTLPNLQHLWISREIVRMAESIKPCNELKITTVSYDEPSLVFLAGTDTRLYLEGQHAAAELQHDPCQVAVVDDNRLGPFLYGSPYAEAEPHPAGEIRNYNLGHGGWRNLSFYVMTPDAKPKARQK